jgi:hypothetical protein
MLSMDVLDPASRSEMEGMFSCSREAGLNLEAEHLIDGNDMHMGTCKMSAFATGGFLLQWSW